MARKILIGEWDGEPVWRYETVADRLRKALNGRDDDVMLEEDDGENELSDIKEL